MILKNSFNSSNKINSDIWHIQTSWDDIGCIPGSESGTLFACVLFHLCWILLLKLLSRRELWPWLGLAHSRGLSPPRWTLPSLPVWTPSSLQYSIPTYSSEHNMKANKIKNHPNLSKPDNHVSMLMNGRQSGQQLWPRVQQLSLV